MSAYDPIPTFSGFHNRRREHELMSGVQADTHRQCNASFHQKHGHVSRMACITPICALTLHFSMCWFAHSLKASTIAPFDTNDFGHAEGIDIAIKSGGSLKSFKASPFVKT